MMYGIVVHGGAGGTSSRAENTCRHATQIAMEILREWGSALDAVVAAVVWMENSGIYNAGVGSILRIDGLTIECDAVVATSEGEQGAVGAVRGVKNPILLAKAVMESPHRMMVAGGAAEFAARIGLEPHPGPTPRVRRRYESMRRAIDRGDLGAIAPGWTSEDLDRFWGLEGALVVPKCCDTVGAVAVDRNEKFAVAGSTGGSGLMASGRVGDVPSRGAGWEIGFLGGILATGIGEVIMEMQGSLRVSRLLEVGLAPQQACEQGVRLFPPDVPVGFIALTEEGVGVASNYPMPSHSILEEEE